MIKYIWPKKYNNTKIRLIMTVCGASGLANNNQRDSSDSTKINNINQKIKAKTKVITIKKYGY